MQKNSFDSSNFGEMIHFCFDTHLVHSPTYALNIEHCRTFPKTYQQTMLCMHTYIHWNQCFIKKLLIKHAKQTPMHSWMWVKWDISRMYYEHVEVVHCVSNWMEKSITFVSSNNREYQNHINTGTQCVSASVLKQTVNWIHRNLRQCKIQEKRI